MYYGVLGAEMAFSTLARGPDKLGTGLLGLRFWTCTVYKKATSTRAKAMTIAMKTVRNDTVWPQFGPNESQPNSRLLTWRKV